MTKILKEILINDGTFLEDKIKAITAADIDVINRRYEENENVTILHHFCMNPNVELVKAILTRNPDLTIKDDFGQTPLFAACLADEASIEIVKLLLNAGAKIDIKDNQDQTILQYGDEIPQNIKNLITETQKRQNAVTENLPNNIGNKIEDRSLTTNSSSESELTKALKKKNPDFGTRLENAADKEARERRDEASKVKATEDKYTTKESSSSDFRSKTKQIINFESNVFSIELIESLIADSTLLQREDFPQELLTEQDKKGNTLLHILSRNGAAEAIKILIELIGKDEAARESINTQNNDKQTSLDYAVVKNKKEVIDLLKIAGGKTGKALEIERAAQDAKKLRDEEDRKIEEEGRLKIEQERKDTENKERIEAEQRKRDEIENARLEAQTSSSALSVDLSGDPLRSSARKSAVTSYNSSVEDIEVCIDDKNTNLLSKTKSSSDLASNNYADFQARLREYHLHTTHSDNQNVCYNPQLKKELLGSDQNGVLNFHKTLGAQAEENRNKNYSKVPLLESSEKNSFSDYGLASQDALDNCTLKTFPLPPDGLNLNMAIEKSTGKVYLSKTSIAEIKRQGLTLSIKIPSKTGGAPEYLEFINGVLHIVDTPVGESRIAGKGELHKLSGYDKQPVEYSNQLTLTNGHNSKIASFDDKDSAEDNNPSDDRLKRKRSNSLDGNILSPSPSIKRSKIAETSFPDLFAKQESSREELEEKQKELVQVLRSQIEKGTVDKESVRAVSDEIDENNRKRLYRAASPSKTTAIVKEALKATSFGRAVGKRLFPLGLGNEAEEKLTKEQKTKDELNEHLDSSLTSTHALLEEIHSLEESYKQVSDEIQFLQGAKQAFFEKIQAEFKDDSTEWWKDHYENTMTESQKIALLKAGPEKAFEEAEKIAKHNNQEFVKRDVFNYMAKRDDITSHTSEKQEEIKGEIKKVVGHLAPLNEALKLHFEQKTKSSQPLSVPPKERNTPPRP